MVEFTNLRTDKNWIYAYAHEDIYEENGNSLPNKPTITITWC